LPCRPLSRHLHQGLEAGIGSAYYFLGAENVLKDGDDGDAGQVLDPGLRIQSRHRSAGQLEPDACSHPADDRSPRGGGET
jgi:hypothetical protein